MKTTLWISIIPLLMLLISSRAAVEYELWKRGQNRKDWLRRDNVMTGRDEWRADP